MAQDERRDFKMIESFPCMLRLSKHSESFFNNVVELYFGERGAVVRQASSARRTRGSIAPVQRVVMRRGAIL